MRASTIIEKLCNLFSLFEFLGYVNGRRQGGGRGGPWPPWIFTHSLLNRPNFKNSLIFSCYYWPYSYWPPSENFSANALGFVHLDQGSDFMSSELKEWLREKGIPTSQSTRYNRKGNGQVERFNGVIWKSVLLELRVKNLPISRWETVSF